MPRKTWYALMLFMPLLVPAFYFLLAWNQGNEALLAQDMVVRFVIICSVICSAPYLGFSLVVLLYCRRKTADEIRKLSWWLPWMFMPVCGVLFYIGFNFAYPKGDALEASLIMAALIVPAGFFYVIAVHVMTRIAIHFKLVTG